jgi:long-chain acyl-CoA synthetase
MYPAIHAQVVPDRPAVIMSPGGARVTYAELDERSARLAAVFRAAGARRGDTVVLALPNDVRWAEVVWACLRSGLYIAPLNWHLTAAELTPLLEDAAPRVIVTSASLHPAMREAVRAARRGPAPLWLVAEADEVWGGSRPADVLDHDLAVAETPRDHTLVETLGGRLLFSSGTMGRPKPFRVDPVDVHPADARMRLGSLLQKLGFTSGDLVYLATGPAYHAGPFAFLQAVHQLGGTAVMMPRFDPEGALAAIAEHGVTHSQWVPTMFIRMLRLPEEIRRAHDLSSHRVAVHAGAPCPVEVKTAMLDWWGPIIHEYYGASEGVGSTAIGPEEWLERPGSVGRPTDGDLHVTDVEGRDLPRGEVGIVWFRRPGASDPVRRPEGTADLAATPGWGTAGDLGHVDAAGYLHLTGRASHVIISGGVNIYPREIEDRLALHPAVADIAVIGVPHDEFGEQVKAIVQPTDDARPGPELAAELVRFCRDRLARHKCPRSVDFVERLPRSEAGKVLVAELRARYWPAPSTAGRP